ncbi:inositol monophosphatase [Sphingomonas sp. HMWF008]|nr:inositol monophosphatase [Sphingomonas sp. HMWF008]
MLLQTPVAALMREVAAREILPRFRTLPAHDIVEKSPGEIVTRADREAELRLRDGLDQLALGARVIGEEAAAEDPTLLDDAGRGLVWLVDPLDGTGNFASGHAPFGVMVALAADGVPIESWMLDPLTGRLCHAVRDKGATIDGKAVRIGVPSRARPIAALATQFMPEQRRARVHARAERHCDVVPIPRCAAESYPRLVLGQNDVALFQRILPWDHAPGVLFLQEAGGVATHWDGEPYRVGSDSSGLLVAGTEKLWQTAAKSFLSAAAPLHLPEGIAA